MTLWAGSSGPSSLTARILATFLPTGSLVNHSQALSFSVALLERALGLFVARHHL